MPIYDGSCPDLHQTKIGKDARRGCGGLFVFAMNLNFEKSSGLIAAVMVLELLSIASEQISPNSMVLRALASVVSKVLLSHPG